MIRSMRLIGMRSEDVFDCQKIPRVGEATKLTSNRELSHPLFHFGCVLLTSESHNIGSSAHHAPVSQRMLRLILRW